MEVDTRSENVAQPAKVGGWERASGAWPSGCSIAKGSGRAGQAPVRHSPLLPSESRLQGAAKKAPAKAPLAAANAGKGKTIEETYQKLSQVRCV